MNRMATDTNFQSHKFSFQKPAIYEIVVEGKLEKTWSDKLGGMQITFEDSTGTSGNVISSTLVGRIADQSALAGVLNALIDAHLKIISVDMIK